MDTIIHNFEDLSVSKLNGAASLTLKVNSTLKKLGFGKAILNNAVINEDSFEEDLAIYFMPSMNNINYIARRPGRSTFCGLRNYLRGLDGNSYMGEYYSLRDNNFKNQVSLKIKHDDKKIEVGHYLPDRNIIIFYLPILNDWDLGLNNKYVIQLLKYIEEIFENYPIREIDIGNIKKKIILEKFVERINESIQSIDSEIISKERYIKEYNDQLVRWHREKIEYISNKRNKEKFKEDVVSGMDDKIEEIKKLKFVESVKLGDDGILVKFATIHIKVKDEDILMGNYTITIKPESIGIVNDKPITRQGSIYHSPHISGDNVCFGDQGSNVTKLLGEYDFKRLTHFLWMYLNSYNQGDTYLPMHDWVAGRKNKGIVPMEHHCSCCDNRVMDDLWNDDMSMCNACAKTHIHCRGCGNNVDYDDWDVDRERCNNCVEDGNY